VAGTVTTNMSGTTVNVLADETNSSGVYFGGKSLTAQNVTNNVTGGTIAFTDNRTDTSKSQKYVGVHFGPNNGTITGTLTNNVSGITVNGKLTAGTTVYFGGQSLGWRVGKIVNTVGLEGVAGSGPVINTDANIYMGGGWTMAGDVTNSAISDLPAVDASTCSDDVVISNTIYDITMKNTGKCLYGGSSSGYLVSGSNTYRHRIMGSIETNIYGGTIGVYYGATGAAPVYGHVTTNIYGGRFASVNGTSASGDIYDGAEVNIYKVCKTDGTAVGVSMKPYQASANAGAQALLSAVTADRKVAVLNIAPEVAGDAVIGYITVPETDAAVNIDKGTFSGGLKVNDAAATSDMIAANRYIVSAADLTEIQLADAVGQGCIVTDQLITVKVHCDCGTRTQDSDPIGNCKGACDGTLRTWQPWTSTNSLPMAATEAGFYYLTGNVITTGQSSFKASADNTYTTFGIDLNGYDITHAVKAGTKDGARALVNFGGYNADASNAANTWKTDLIITDTAAVHGSVITDQSALTGGNQSHGNVLWVRKGNMYIYNVTLDGSQAVTTKNGAAISMDSATGLYMYNTTVLGGVSVNGTSNVYGGAIYTYNSTLVMEDCTVIGGQATHGGAIFAGAGVTATLTGTTVTDGQATKAGGNIYCNPGSNVTLNGCMVLDGECTNGDKTGGNIQADGNFTGGIDNRSTLTINGGTVGLAKNETSRGLYISKSDVTVTGDAQLADCYLRNGELATQGHFSVDLTGLTEGAEVVYTPEIWGRSAAITEEALQYITVGKEYTSNLEETKADPTVEPIMVAGDKTVEDGALVITKGNAAVLIHADKTETEYLTLRAAAKAYVEGDILKVLYGFYDDVEAPTGLDLVFDIAGTTHRGTFTLSEGNKFYLMDSATDTYGDQGANQYCAAEVLGGEIFTGSFKAPNAKRYLIENGRTDTALGTYNKLYASRYYVGFTKLYLEPCKGSFNAGYRLEMAGNAKIKNKLSDTVGMKLWVGADEANATEVTITKDKFGNNNSFIATVTDLLGGDAAAQATAATTNINAKAVGSLNGEEFTATVAFNLKQMVETADAAFATLTADQQSCLKVCYDRYESLMSSWNITNMK